MCFFKEPVSFLIWKDAKNSGISSFINQGKQVWLSEDIRLNKEKMIQQLETFGKCGQIIKKIKGKKLDLNSFTVLVSTYSFPFQRSPSVVKWNLKVSKQIYENAIIPVIVQQSLPKPFVSNFSEHLNRSWVINLVFLPDSTKRWSSLLKCRILSETQVPRRLNTKGWGV